MEKHDNEAFQILRTKHERNVLELAESVRYSQWQEAIKAREGIEKTMANVVQRYTYYERQLGKSQSDIQVPDAGTHRRGLARDDEVPCDRAGARAAGDPARRGDRDPVGSPARTR